MRCEIRVEGVLDERWSGWFDGLQIASQPTCGVTVIAGQVADQAALHGLFAGLRLVPAPGHTRGSQVVAVETGGHPVVVGGDVEVWFGELDEPHTEGQLRVRALDPSWSGSRTSTSRGDPVPSKASRRRSLGLPGFRAHHSRLLRQGSSLHATRRLSCSSSRRSLDLIVRGPRPGWAGEARRSRPRSPARPGGGSGRAWSCGRTGRPGTRSLAHQLSVDQPIQLGRAIREFAQEVHTNLGQADRLREAPRGAPELWWHRAPSGRCGVSRDADDLTCPCWSQRSRSCEIEGPS